MKSNVEIGTVIRPGFHVINLQCIEKALHPFGCLHLFVPFPFQRIENHSRHCAEVFTRKTFVHLFPFDMDVGLFYRVTTLSVMFLPRYLKNRQHTTGR